MLAICVSMKPRHLSHILPPSSPLCFVRVNFLKSKKFSPETVASMVTRAPYLLNFSVKRMDNRLGFYQEQLGLNPSKVSPFSQIHP